MVIPFRVVGLAVLFFVAPAALAQVDFLPGERLAVSVGAFTQGGDVSASGFEVEGFVSPRFALSVGLGRTSFLQSRPWPVQDRFEEDNAAITTFTVGARGFVRRQGVNSPATLSLGVNGGAVAFHDGDDSTKPFVGITVRTIRVASFPGDRFFVAPSGSLGLAAIFDSRVAATTASLGAGFGLGFRPTSNVLVAVNPNLTVAYGPASSSVVAFAATFGLTLSY
jgi:hypothetical protein